jgi:hypothetical protein
MKKLTLTGRLLLAIGFVLVFSQSAFSGGPVGHPDTLEGSLRYSLQEYLDGEGYMGDFHNGQDLQRGISAYLWDNRDWLTSSDFHNSRKVDALVCLLDKKGYPGFDAYLDAEVIKNWCDKLVVKP